MNHEHRAGRALVNAFLTLAERSLARKPRLIAGSFFSLSMLMVVYSHFSGDPIRIVAVRVLLAAAVALLALGLRYIERYFPPAE